MKLPQEHLKSLLRQAPFSFPREQTKTIIVKIVHEVRLAARELGRRLSAVGKLEKMEHIFMMRDVDLEDAIAGSMLSIAADREKEYLALFELNPRFGFQRRFLQEKHGKTPHPLHQTEVLQGMGGSSGTATGTAKVILTPLITDLNQAIFSSPRLQTPLGHHYLCLQQPLLLMSAPQ